jgi:hypothetical protein
MRRMLKNFFIVSLLNRNEVSITMMAAKKAAKEMRTVNKIHQENTQARLALGRVCGECSSVLQALSTERIREARSIDVSALCAG